MFTIADMYWAELLAFIIGWCGAGIPLFILLARSKRHSAWQGSQIALLLEGPKRDSRGRFVE